MSRVSKIKANYYYVAICTESWATLDRLSIFFSTLYERIDFSVINISECKLDDVSTFSDCEKEFVNSIYANKATLLYGKLYINGSLIEGFPPSSKMIEDKLTKLSINADFKLLKTFYNLPLDNISLKKGNSRTEILSIKNTKEQCRLCTKYSRYINEENYSKINWDKYETSKSMYLNQAIREKRIIGFVEYMSDQAVGFIEGYSCNNTVNYGFPIEKDENKCMITCLHIRKEASGKGIARKLISKFIYEAKKKGFKSIEVLAFADEINWQPVSLYTKMEFVEKSKIGDFKLMRLDL